MDTMTHRRLLHAEEVAERLGIALWAAYQMIREGELPSVRLGRRVRVSPDALEKFIENGGTAAG